MDTRLFLAHFPQHAIQFFDDTRKKPALAKTLSSCSREEALAAQARGCGVFFTVNGFRDGRRVKSNLARFNGVFIDGDVAKEDQALSKAVINDRKAILLRQLNSAPLIPHFITETKNGLQPIWLVDDLEDKEVFLAIEKALIARFNADPLHRDVTSVLRLPGYYHLKNTLDPFLCELVLDRSQVPPYHVGDLIKAFDVKLHALSEAPAITHPPSQTTHAPMNATNGIIRRAIALPIRDVIRFAAGEVGIRVSFRRNSDGSDQIIEDGRETSGFISSHGNFCHSMSEKPRRGNPITVAEYYLNHFGGRSYDRLTIAKILLNHFN